MAGTRCVVGSLEENQISWFCFLRADDYTVIFQTVGGQPAYIPAISAVVDDPAYKAGAVKAGTRRAAAPDIGITEIFLCFGNHLPEFFIRQSFARNVVILIFSAGTRAVRRCKGDACKQIIPIAPALQCDFVALQLVICKTGISGNIVHTPIEQRYICLLYTSRIVSNRLVSTSSRVSHPPRREMKKRKTRKKKKRKRRHSIFKFSSIAFSKRDQLKRILTKS